MGRNAQAGAVPNRPDDERKHIAAVRMEGSACIVLGCEQSAAQSHYGSVAVPRDA